MKIGQTIRRLRLERRAEADNWRDWTQSACAGRAGINTSQWGDLEADRHSPTVDMLEKAAAALGCAAADLV